MKIQDLEKKSFGHADQTLVEELKSLREENQDRIRGMENLHGIIESSQKLLEDKKIEIANLESKVEELNSKVSQSDDALKSLEDLSSQVKEKVQIISSLNEELHVAKLKAEVLEKQQNDQNDIMVNQIDPKVKSA